MTLPPAKNPCGSCPYRRDVPSGVWAAEEYEKLPHYDEEMARQPPGVFLCHQQNGRLCAGWAGCHNMAESLAVRILALAHPEVAEGLLDYSTPTPLFASGAEAAEHGAREILMPGEQARRVVEKIERRIDRNDKGKA